MKTKQFLVAIALLVNAATFAQTAVNKTFAVKSGQKIKMHFDYPKVIKVSTWEKNEISITGSININEGENDDAFVFENSSGTDEISVNGKIKDIDKLPHRITIKRDGRKIMFKTKADYNAYASQNGHDFRYKSWGPDIEISLEIKVPSNVDTKVLLVYGIIEIKDFIGPLTAESTYGGVDAALTEKSVGDLKAVTDFGQIFTNMNFKVTGGEFEAFHTVVSTNLGSGPAFYLESKYGNVYLRKAL
ncbi:MAG: hypothetical protein JSS79_06155 [Bacteroidetes bacterium]|nr:hypothetical protein [Bacteroidota bacterium]